MVRVLPLTRLDCDSEQVVLTPRLILAFGIGYQFRVVSE